MNKEIKNRIAEINFINDTAALVVLNILNCLNDCIDENGKYDEELLFTEESFNLIAEKFQEKFSNIEGFNKLNDEELSQIIVGIARKRNSRYIVTLEELKTKIIK